MASFFGNELILRNALETTEETVKAVDEVKIDDIVQLAQMIFQPQYLNFSLIGPFEKKEDFKDILTI